MACKKIIKELTDVDFEENIEIVFGFIKEWDERITKLEVEMIGRRVVFKDDKVIFCSIVEDMCEKITSFMNINTMVIVELGQIKYLEPEKELKYEKISATFDKIKDIFNKILDLESEFVEKMEECETKINECVGILNKSLSNMLKIGGVQENVANYSKSLLEFSEKRMNENNEEIGLNKVICMRNKLKKLKWFSKMFEEAVILVYFDYSAIHPKKESWENSSSIY